MRKITTIEQDSEMKLLAGAVSESFRKELDELIEKYKSTATQLNEAAVSDLAVKQIAKVLSEASSKITS